MSPQTNPSTTLNQHHPNTHTSRSTSIPILLASIVALLAAITIAVFFGNEDTAGLFGLRRIFGGGVASSRPSSILRQASPAVQGFSSSALATDEVKMRTPVYFLSHGGVRSVSSSRIDIIGLTNCEANRYVPNRPPRLQKARPDRPRDHDQSQAACCGGVLSALAGVPGYDPGEYGGDYRFDL